MKIENLIDQYKEIATDAESLSAELSKEAAKADSRDDIEGYLELEEAAGHIQVIAGAIRHYIKCLEASLRFPSIKRAGAVDFKYAKAYLTYLRAYERELKGMGMRPYWSSSAYQSYCTKIELLASRLGGVATHIIRG